MPHASATVRRSSRSTRSTLLLVGSLALPFLLPGVAQSQDYAAKGFQVATPTPRETTPENLAAGKELYGSTARNVTATRATDKA